MSIKAETTFSLKDQLFNQDTATLLAQQVASVDPRFNVDQFVVQALADFPKLALKERINHLVSCLARQLPENFDQAQGILRAALPAPLDANLQDDDFGQFIWVVPGEYVAAYGCTAEHVETSLSFLREATMRFSSEFALRPFLHRFPEITLTHVQRWTADENYHVRRLASEGTRPYLPWGQRVVLPVPALVDILHRLHADPTRYVTRSVANALNDLTKLDADKALEVIQHWQAEQAQDPGELKWMVSHALRSLLKADDPRALALCGYPLNPKFVLSNVAVSSHVVLGDPLEFSAVLKSQIEQQLRIALRVHFLKANGTHSVKVFAIKDVAARPDEKISISKRLPFKPMTTRVLYPGQHYVELVVNGVKRNKHGFELML